MHCQKLIFSILLITFIVLYVATMCPTVYTMDNGELILAAYKMHIAHPTGYPLFCLLGKLGSFLIPVGSVAWRVNALNAIIAAAAVAALFVALSQVARMPIALFVASLFGISPLFWDAASSTEVHALNALLISLALFLFLRWRRTGGEGTLCWLAFISGMSLTNHLSAGLLLPGFALGVVLRDRTVLRNGRLLARLFLLFMLPLSLYLYLPLRATASRGTIWGDLYAAYGFLAHISGRLFRRQMFAMMSLADVWSNFHYFLELLLRQFPIYLAWALPVGGVLLRREHKGLLSAVGLMLSLSVVYALGYSIIDIEPYYIPAMLLLCIFAAVGLDFALQQSTRPFFRISSFCLLPVLFALILCLNLPEANKSKATFVMDFAHNVLKTAEKNALFVACGDAPYNAVLYAQTVEGMRQDLIVLQRDILRAWLSGDARWTARYYYQGAAKRSPAMRAVRWEGRYDKKAVENEVLLRDVISAVFRERPIYMSCTGNNYRTHPILKQIKGRYRAIPEGVLYRLHPANERLDLSKLALRSERIWRSYELRGIYDGIRRGSRLEREIPSRYAAFHVALGNLELDAKLFGLAATNYRKALSINPNLHLARTGLGLAYACLGRYRDAAQEWQEVIRHRPDDNTARLGLKMVRAVLSSSESGR